MKPIIDSERVRVFHADCVDVLRHLPDCSVDSVVTDPPYELGFMGKTWDASGIAYSVDLWAECLRVLKPGGHLLAFGGTRTWHRLACAIEDAGFEVRDSIAWLYGSGFPKSLDVSKAIDKAAGAEREVVTRVERDIFGEREVEVSEVRMNEPNGIVSAGQGERTVVERKETAPATPETEQWQGWGTALKPAHEPIVVARKPLEGTVAGNVLKHGTGALNVDGCRIGTEVRSNPPGSSGPRVAMGGGWRDDASPTIAAGRWPANVVLDEHTAPLVDAQSGISTSPPVGSVARKQARIGQVAKGDERARVAPNGHGDSGGASRFFYCAKAPRSERPKVDGIAHPTVKPLTLMRWLCRLVTPPGGTIFEPFAGSGTTLEAALQEGFKVIACEMTAEYLPLIEARIARVPVRVSDLFESVD